MVAEAHGGAAQQIVIRIVEILLKLEGKVPVDYCELQDRYKNQNCGLDFAREQTIEGLTFHQHDTAKDGTFADRIAAELKAGRFVGVYALNPSSTTDYHGWVAVGIQNDVLLLRSKYSEHGNGEGQQTAVNDQIHISKAIPPQVTDCVFYTTPNGP